MKKITKDLFNLNNSKIIIAGGAGFWVRSFHWRWLMLGLQQ
jgi:hypothetical protein|tara:strand:- start:815 stop:937 length:123 start_codon:yes stop_codon:yes gene_type:complete